MIQFKTDFKFNANDLEKALMKAAAEKITKRVRNVRCPEHSQYACIVARGHSTKELKFDVSGCCEKLIEEVKRKLQ